MEVNCERREASTVATQSLMLMNSQFMLDQSATFAQRLEKEAGNDPMRQITLAWQLAFSRQPTPTELNDASAFLSRQSEYLKSVEAGKATAEKDEKAKAPQKPRPTPELQALTDLCQSLLSANEFLYTD
jgi:hypothetical protein